MPLNNKLTVGSSPHVRSGATTTGIMLDVIIALVPALIASVYYFGPRTLLLTGVCVGTCMAAEYAARKIMKKPNTLGDLSAIVTGILLAFNLPVSLPLWMAAIGAVVAIVVVKQFFGGLGKNFVNPALMARIVLFLSFGKQMTTWVVPRGAQAAANAVTSASLQAVDAVTTASPLGLFKLKGLYLAGNMKNIEKTLGISMLDMFFGRRAGSLGEVCAIALILGGAYLLFRRVITPVIPLTYIGTFAAVMLLAGKGDFTFVGYQVLAGGLLLGAIFMATDYATSPMNIKGQLVYAAGCGLITAAIRLFGSMPEGVSFSIILMNILVPHIERLTMPKAFGTLKEKRADKEKSGVKA